MVLCIDKFTGTVKAACNACHVDHNVQSFRVQRDQPSAFLHPVTPYEQKELFGSDVNSGMGPDVTRWVPRVTTGKAALEQTLATRGGCFLKMALLSAAHLCKMSICLKAGFSVPKPLFPDRLIKLPL